MRRTFIVVITLLLMLVISPVIAVQTPTLTINGVPVNLKEQVEVSEVVQGSGDNVQHAYELAAPIKTNEYEISNLVLVYKEDPFISYGLAVTDIGAPSTFSFVFSAPIVPVAGANAVSSSFSASTTDGQTNDGVNVTALAPPAEIPVDSDGITELQVTTVFDGSVRKNIGLDLAGPFKFNPYPPRSGVWGPFDVGPVSGPVSATAWNELRIDVNFQLSGNGDILTANGESDIVETPNVPEFPTLALPVALIIGLLGAVLFIRNTKE
jgi:hypothetical protein